jgi:PAS domain S-box-containing protein
VNDPEEEMYMQKQVEKDLFESRKLLQAIIDSGPECINLIAADGTLIMMNRAGLDMIEADSLETVKGRSIFSLLQPAYVEAFKKLTDEVFQGKTGNLTYEMLGVKGGRLWLDTHAVPLRNDEHEIVALVGITRDITEWKRTEEVLKKERDFS